MFKWLTYIDGRTSAVYFWSWIKIGLRRLHVVFLNEFVETMQLNCMLVLQCSTE